MRSPTGVPDRGLVPRGLLGLLALVAVVEATLARVEDRRFATNYSLSWKFSGRAAQRRARDCDVLCFGDSMVKYGIAPEVLEARGGRRTYNLAVYSGSPTSSYFLLRRALAAGARPSALLIDIPPSQLVADPWYEVRVLPEVTGLSDCLELGAEARDAGLVARLLLTRSLPSARARFEVRASLAMALLGGSYAEHIRAEWLPAVRNWRVHRGGEVAAPEPAFTGGIPPGTEWLFPNPWSPNPVMTAFARRFLDLAAARGVPVFWLLPPLSPEIQAHCERIGLDAAFSRFARDLQARYPNLTVVDARHAGYPHTAFRDAAHLARPGACRLSADVAAVMARCLGSGPTDRRWFDLPAFRATSEGMALEDVHQSRLALESPSQARRR